MKAQGDVGGEGKGKETGPGRETGADVQEGIEGREGHYSLRPWP